MLYDLAAEQPGLGFLPLLPLLPYVLGGGALIYTGTELARARKEGPVYTLLQETGLEPELKIAPYVAPKLPAPKTASELKDWSVDEFWAEYDALTQEYRRGQQEVRTVEGGGSGDGGSRATEADYTLLYIAGGLAALGAVLLLRK